MYLCSAQADMRSGKTRIAVEGTVTRPAKLAALDLRLDLAGPSMDQLYYFTKVLLPTTGPFSTSGHLTGTLGEDSKRWIYEESMRTPLLVQYPGHIEAGSKVDALVQNIDYAPTVLQYAGVPVPADIRWNSPGRRTSPLPIESRCSRAPSRT